MAPLEFYHMPTSEYLDRYDGITPELNVNMEYDDVVDVTTTYLGYKSIRITDIFRPEQAFPIHSNCHTWGQFVGGGMLDILLETGASKSYMSKGFYMRHPYLHKYPKFNSTVKNLQVGNGELVATLFVIPFIFKVAKHMFEVYTLVAEIQQNMDIILGVKNMFEIEGEISCRTSQFRFLNRSLPIFTLYTYRIKVGAKAYVKVKVPFIKKLSGHAIAKLLLIHGFEGNHLDRLEALFKALIKHGLKLSPKKCQLFIKHLTYMGNVFHINGLTISITPLQSRVEAIQKLQPPTNVKRCKSFCGVVNYLSIFCRHLQKLLKPIYDLTKKGRPFVWQEEQQQAFDTIKERMINPPILYLPKPGGRFILYCDSSRTHTGSSLWQVQEGKPRLIGYASKSLPAPAINYSVTELEMTGMAVNIHLWRHLLHRVEFDCAVDHRAIPYIMKAKTLPATTRIMRLLEILSGYAFNLYFVKGKDMKICDFLSRIDVDRGNPGEVIPISFNSFSMLNIMRKVTLHQANKLLVTTRSKTKAEGAALPPVHGVQKHLDPAVKPEHDKPVTDQNKQKGPTSADTKPKVLLRPRLPASQMVKKKLIDRSIKLLNKPKPQISVPKRLPQLPGQEIIDQREVNLPDQKPVVQRGPPQRQLVNDTNLPQVVKQPVNTIPARHFEPSPLLEVPPPSK